MITSLLKKLTTVSCMSLIGLGAYAEANLLMPKRIDTSKNHIHYIMKTDKVKTHVVQIFSSINATKAEGMKNTLAMHGYPAFIKQQQPYYQVQIGPFSSKDLASNAKSSIIKRYPTYSFLNDAILKVSP